MSENIEITDNEAKVMDKIMDEKKDKEIQKQIAEIKEIKASEEYLSPYQEDLDKIINNNPQKELFWNLYLEPTSSTFGNVVQSALRAGFTDSQAYNIKQQRWFKSGIRRNDMVDKAEEVLESMLSLPKNKVKIVNGEETVVEDPGLIKIRQDTAKYVTSTLAKDAYSTKVEENVKHSGTIKTDFDISDEQFDNLMNEYAKRQSGNEEIGT